VIDDLAALVKLITGWVRAGLRTDEILERLANPAGLGRRLIDRAVARHQAGRNYLGRDPK
jgi:hypothetical protein